MEEEIGIFFLGGGGGGGKRVKKIKNFFEICISNGRKQTNTAIKLFCVALFLTLSVTRPHRVCDIDWCRCPKLSINFIVV